MSEAYEYGFDAGACGLELYHNPYPPHSIKAKDWEDGFYDAMLK